MIDQSRLESLTVSEKLHLVTSLWNQIARSNHPLSVPDAVINDAARRIDQMIANPSAGLTEEEVWRHVDETR